MIFRTSVSDKTTNNILLPVLIFMWLAKKFKLRYLLVMFLVIFLTFIPSYIAGAPFSMPFNMYRSQLGYIRTQIMEQDHYMLLNFQNFTPE